MNTSVNNPDVEPIEVKIKKQTDIALAKLNFHKLNNLHLARPVIFVPGWADESCGWWQNPFQGIQCVKQWIQQVVDNPDLVEFVNFGVESPQCESFLNFGKILKSRILALNLENQSFDLVGHSMGGLDIRAALIFDEPVLNCINCITADAPHQGDIGGKFLELAQERDPSKVANYYTPYQVVQAQNMYPSSGPMQLINSSENRQLFLNRVSKFTQLKGTRDWMVGDSCFMDPAGLKFPKEKIQYFSAEGCEHVWTKGITLDIRVILTILYTLVDFDIPGMENQGNLPGGNDVPVDDRQIFIDLTEY